MKILLLSGLLVLALASCRKDQENAQPEYADWYTLRAPDSRAIEAVCGDIDDTLVITTRYAVYQTTNRGKTWQTGDYKESVGLFGFLNRADTLFAMSAKTGTAFDTTAAYVAYGVSPAVFSLNKGLHWQPYRSVASTLLAGPIVPLNRLVAASGTEYSIAYRLIPIGPQSTAGYIETLGIKTSAGRRLTLPKRHDITSIYFDKKSRLYVTASAELCGSSTKLVFCGEQNGVLYVSKKPQL